MLPCNAHHCLVEAALNCNRRRREQFDPQLENDGGSEVNSAVHHHHPYIGNSDAGDSAATSSPCELDIYRTTLYLAKYQCTTAFHAFFPATAKPCKGYHFWCAIGSPLPMFDRLLRDGVERIKKEKNLQGSLAPNLDVSEVALGFRCVFGHLI